MHRTEFDSRRGFAMLLVLISLAVATVLATAYLSSRDNSAMIGANASSGTSARWAALATLHSGIAVLETDTDWRTNHTNGVVFANASLAGADVDLKYMDLVTGNPPTDDTTDVEVTATARVNGIEESVVAHASVPKKEPKPDLDLSEFALFGKDKVKIKDTSLITRWSKSPRSALNLPLAIGTANTSASAVELTDFAVAIDSVVYKIAGASNMLVSNSGPGSIQTKELPDTIVVPGPPSSGVLKPLALVSALWSSVSLSSSATSTITNNSNIKALTLTSNAVLYIQGPATVTVANNMDISSGARIQVKGDVKLVVFGQINMDADTSIDLEDGATMQLYAANSVDMDSASINELNAGKVRDASGDAVWMESSRFAMYETGSATNNWTLTNGSVVKGHIYAPNQVVKVEKSSAVYGNIVAQEIELASGGNVYYDPTLDTGNGYTVYDSAVYASDGLIQPVIKTVSNLSTATLNLVQAVLDLLTVSPAPVVGPGDPTPRTVNVTYEIVSTSNDTALWEKRASLIAEAK